MACLWRSLGLGALFACAFASGGCGDDAPPSSDGGVDAGTCEPPSALCGSRCVDVRSDPMHCGACGEVCAGGAFCSGGACARACTAPLTACGASCVDVTTDGANCGACGTACESGEVCRGGRCQCPEGTSECEGVCVDISFDPENCGLCGRACASDQICNMGSCTCASDAREVACDDGADDDCDDLVDCDDPDCVGVTRGCSGVCGMGVETCEAGGTWGICVGGTPMGVEICGDGIDQDCDGADLRMPDGYEPNDTCATCPALVPSGGGDPVDPNVFLNATFDSVDDRVDCFRFEADDSGSPVREWIRIDLTQIPAGHDYDVYLYANRADCDSRTALARSTNSGNADDQIVWGERFGADDSGTYYVEVRRFRGTSCTEGYRLSVNGLR